jgi:site-specific DNA recombinase
MIQNPFYYGEMCVKGRNFPHVYEPLITKELYDACQAVRFGWHKKPFAYGEKDYVFRGLLTCATTGKVVTAYTKVKTYGNGRKAEYTYLMCWNPENPAKKLWVREE